MIGYSKITIPEPSIIQVTAGSVYEKEAIAIKTKAISIIVTRRLRLQRRI